MKKEFDVLSHAKFPKSSCEEAVKTTIDTINLSLSVPLDGGSLKEVQSGKKVSYNHLKVFGCQEFVHILKDERAKLDSKTTEYVYHRSPRDEYDYQLWDLVNKKIIRR